MSWCGNSFILNPNQSLDNNARKLRMHKCFSIKDNISVFYMGINLFVCGLLNLVGLSGLEFIILGNIIPVEKIFQVSFL